MTITQQVLQRRALVVPVAMLLAFLSGPRTAAQQSQDARGTQVAAVDFVVVSKADGQPVTDLKPEEVTLRIDGKPRPIKTLQFVRMSAAISGPGSAATMPESDVAAPFATNRATTAEAPRAIVLVVDDESMPIGQEQKLRSALSNFVQDLPPSDLVALVTVPHGGLKVGFTTDRDRLRREIANISPITPNFPAACQTLTMLETLESTLGLLGRTANQPVTVALLSASMTGQSVQEVALRPSATGGGVSAQAGGCHVATDNFVRVGHIVAAAHAQLYIIHPDFTQSPAQEGIENLRGQTNAPLFHLSAGTEPGLYRMVRETAGYYVATFDTEPDEVTGKPHTSSVKTTRPGVDVRDRPFLVVGRAAPGEGSRPVQAFTTAYELVRSGRQFRDLQLRATASSFKNADGTLNVIVLFDSSEPNVKIMTATAALFDENNAARDYLNLEADKLTKLPAAIGLKVKPGAYRLRVGAIDANGRTGVVDDNIVAEIGKAGPLQVSGMFLGLPAGAGFTPMIAFTNEPAVTAYVELYGVGEGARVGAQFEIAKTTNGPAMQTFRGNFAATNEDTKFMVSAAIPISALAPGDYVVRAIVQAQNQPATRVIRTLRKQ